MTIDNRSHNDTAIGMLERQSSAVNENLVGGTAATTMSGTGTSASAVATENVAKDEYPPTANTPLQRLIHTKWEEANIRYHMQPSMLSYLFSTSQ